MKFSNLSENFRFFAFDFIGEISSSYWRTFLRNLTIHRYSRERTSRSFGDSLVKIQRNQRQLVSIITLLNRHESGLDFVVCSPIYRRSRPHLRHLRKPTRGLGKMKSRDSDPAHCSVGFLGRVALVIPGRESRRGSRASRNSRFLFAVRCFECRNSYRIGFCAICEFARLRSCWYSWERVKMSFP